MIGHRYPPGGAVAARSRLLGRRGRARTTACPPAGGATAAECTSTSSSAGSAVPRGRWLKTDLYEERPPDRALLALARRGPVGRASTCRRRRRAGRPAPGRPVVVTDARRSLPLRRWRLRRGPLHLDPRPLRRPSGPRLGRWPSCARCSRPAGVSSSPSTTAAQPADPCPQRPAPVGRPAHRPRAVRRGPHARRPGGGRRSSPMSASGSWPASTFSTPPTWSAPAPPVGAGTKSGLCPASTASPGPAWRR